MRGDSMRNFALAICFLLTVSSCASKTGVGPTMFIQFSKEAFEFGDSIPAEIVFVNTSNQPKTLAENPQKSLDLQVHAIHGKTGEGLNFQMGRINAISAGEIVALTVPVPEETVIAPKGVLSFFTDLNDRLYLSPGEYLCHLSHFRVEKSNQVRITVLLTPSGFIHLLKTAVDLRKSYGRREWAYDWLKKMQPDIQLRLSLDTDSAEKRQTDAAFNEKAFAQYVKWWEDNRSSPNFLERIRDLNP
jgi:hypothetical protein